MLHASWLRYLCIHQQRRILFSPLDYRSKPIRYVIAILFFKQLSPHIKLVQFTHTVVGWDLMSVWKMNGCGECCASVKHGVHATDVFIYHNHYSQLPKQARQQWLLDYFNMQSSKDIKTGESETAYLVCGKHVCQSLWIATIGISQSFFYEMKKCFLQGQVKINHEVQRRPLQV